MARRQGATKDWCFTKNNYTDDTIEALTPKLEESTVVTYAIYGKEVGDQGKPHLQGFIQFKVKKCFKGIRQYFDNPGMHLEKCRGTPNEAADYHKKENDFVEFGKRAEHGKQAGSGIANIVRTL